MIQKYPVPFDARSIGNPKLFLNFESSNSKAVIAISDLIDDFDEDGFEEAFSIVSINDNGTLASCGAIYIMTFWNHFGNKFSATQGAGLCCRTRKYFKNT